MKGLILLLLAVGALALTGCPPVQTSATSASQKTSIEAVVAQRMKLRHEHAGILTDKRIAGLMAIDVKDCPDDFRAAWFDYLIAARVLHSRVRRVALIAAGEGKPATNLPSLIKFAVANPALGQYLLVSVNNVDDAWAKVERAGMDYGVMPDVGDADSDVASEATAVPDAAAHPATGGE